MSSHSNFKKDKCWSCEYFSGKREYKKGAFLGNSVYTDTKGKCSNNRTTNCNHEIFEDDWCSKYQKWGVLQSALVIEEQKKESQRILNELRKEQQAIETSSYSSRSITPQERAEMHARWEEQEKQEQAGRKQREVAAQQAKINKINRSPITAGIVGGIITLIAFLLGWIPYWYWDYHRAISKSNLETLFNLGHTMSEPYMQELYSEGLYAKEMRDSVIWIPFVILAVGIVSTIVVVILKNKTKLKRLIVTRKELEELKR